MLAVRLAALDGVTLVMIPTSGDARWVTAAHDPLSVLRGAALEVTLTHLGSGPSLSLAAGRSDACPPGQLVTADASAFQDQNLEFQLHYAVRPLGWLRPLSSSGPLDSATVAGLAALLVTAIVSIARRFQRLRTAVGTTSTIVA